MQSRIVLICVLAGAALAAVPRAGLGQETPVKRLSNVVAVTVDEYAKGIDSTGRLISAQEYQESLDFIADAVRVAHGLDGARAAAIRAAVDTIAWGVRSKVPPQRLDALHRIFEAAAGVEAALDLPAHPPDAAAGRLVYGTYCAACHGDRGLGDGPAGRGLDPAPPALARRDVLAGATPALVYRVISAGVAGTAMPAWGGTLTPQQRWDVVAYIDSLSGGALGAIDVATRPAPPAPPAAGTVAMLLDRALAAARAGQLGEAHDRAVDAYLAFEPLETPARARSPGAVAALERRFGTFRAQLAQGDVAGATSTRDAIAASLPPLRALTQAPAGGWTAFLQSFVIILREGFEAILVIGAIVAFLIATGNRDRLRAIWAGVWLGIAASAVTAVALRTALRAVPASQDLIEGISMLVAVVVLFWVSYWLISKVEAAKWQHFIRERVTRALEAGGGAALGFVAFLAVYREGAETALFYQALFGEGTHLLLPLSLGLGCGAIALAVIFTLFYRYGVRIPLRPFFAITSALLYLMAFVFMGRGIAELQEVDVIPMSVVRGLPHVEALGIHPTLETSIGQALLVVLLLVAIAVAFRPRGAAASGPPGEGDGASSPGRGRTRRTGRRSRGGAMRGT